MTGYKRLGFSTRPAGQGAHPQAEVPGGHAPCTTATIQAEIHKLVVGPFDNNVFVLRCTLDW